MKRKNYNKFNKNVAVYSVYTRKKSVRFFLYVEIVFYM